MKPLNPPKWTWNILESWFFHCKRPQFRCQREMLMIFPLEFGKKIRFWSGDFYHFPRPDQKWWHRQRIANWLGSWNVQLFVWVYHLIWRYGYGSIPINTIFRGMNIHLPAILGFTRYQGFDPSPYVVLPEDLIVIIFFFDWCSPKCHLELREIDHLKPELDKRWILPRGAQKAVPIHDIPIISQEIIIIIYIFLSVQKFP